MYIWDGDVRAIPATLGPVLLWSGQATRARDRALGDWLEQNSDEIRRRYLAWAHELGETMVGGRPLRAHFELRRGVSFWPNSLFFEQSAWRQPSLEPLLKVFAWLLLLEREPPGEVVYEGADRDLAATLAAVCASRGIRCETRRVRTAATPGNVGWRRLLPQPVQAALAWCFLVASRIGLGAQGRGAAVAQRAVLICGPLFNYELRPDQSFYSRFWTALPGELIAGGRVPHWLHYRYLADGITRARATARLLRSLNANAALHGTHELVDVHATAGTFVVVAARWCRLAWRSMSAGAALRRQFPARPEASLWPLIRRDWAKAFRGTGCVENLYYAECFERALRGRAPFADGIYIMENQGWEHSLARAWHSHGHGRLAGVAHSAVRYWDLRYHSDPRRYPGADPQVFPQFVVLNGSAALGAYSATAARRESLVVCEALRYLYLASARASSTIPRRAGTEVVLLVLGDYLATRTRDMLALVGEAQRAVAAGGSSLRVRLKAHPARPPGDEERELANFELVEGGVANLAAEVDIVMASNTTSAALDAYAAGAHVVVHDARDGVNYSPLRGVAGVEFVSDAGRLAQFVRGARSQPVSGAQEFFALDPRLPRWKEFFGISPVQESG